MSRKVSANFSIDNDVLEYHMIKNRGQVSQMIEDYLKSLMEQDKVLHFGKNEEITQMEVALLEAKRKQLAKEEQIRQYMINWADLAVKQDLLKLKNIKEMKSNYSKTAYVIELDKLAGRYGVETSEIEKHLAELIEKEKKPTMVKKAK